MTHFNNKNISFKNAKIGWRSRLCDVLFVKGFKNNKNTLFAWALVYNIFIQLISLVGFVPMIIAFIAPPNNDILGKFNFSLIFIIIPYVVDYFLRFVVLDIHYNVKNYRMALIKQLRSVCSNYQIITVILIYTLTSIYGQYNDYAILFNQVAFDNDIAMIVFSILLLFNISSIFPRFVFISIEIKNYEITKNIIYSRRKSIILTLLAMIFFWLIFSFIVFKLEQNYYQSLPVDQIPSSAITNIGDAMYFTFIAMTTVGFGDLVPHAPATKAVVVILAIFGVCFYAYVGSIFVNIYVEYVNRKKSIRTALFNHKWNEIQNSELLNSINKIMIDNLYKAQMIDDNKYQKMINEINQPFQKIVRTNLLDMKDISIEDDKLCLHNQILGMRNNDENAILLAEKQHQIAVFDKKPKQEITDILYFLPSMVIKKIYHRNYLPVIFSKADIDYDNLDKMIFFQKKPIAEAVFKANVAGYLELDKSIAWSVFGKYSILKESVFHTLFKKEEKIKVILINDFLFFNQKISLEKYAINTNWKIDNVISLI